MKLHQNRPPAILAIIALAASCLVPGTLAAADAGSFTAAMELIRRKDLKQYATVLASDTFEGREAGSRGGKAAGIYLTEQLRNLDVVPGGSGNSYFQHFGSDYRNVLALLTGDDPALKDEYVLVSAHYDHVGYGTRRNSQGPYGYIHNGADDNASGTAGLLELIECLSALEPRPKRSILFAFWDAEEKGLLGSEYWIAKPTVPLAQVKLLMNLDMIGRLRDETIEVYGIRTAPGLRRFVAEQNSSPGLRLIYSWDNKANSDHYPFFQQGIPYLMLHTRMHDDYHRPSDDPDKLNVAGMEQVCRLLAHTVYAAAQQPALPKFRGQSRSENEVVHSRRNARAAPLPMRLGVAWDLELGKKKVIQLTRVVRSSPADKGGLKVGDRIVAFGGQPTDGDVDFRTLVLSARNPVDVLVQRDGNEEAVTNTLQLGGRPRRFGISWRVDEAEPNCVALARVWPGSPAATAGLKPNDRIYSVSGSAISSGPAFRDLMAAAKNPVELIVETEGRIHTVQLTSHLAATSKPAETATKPAAPERP
jgi:hypothetical protein